MKLQQAEDIVAQAEALITEAKRRAEALLVNAEQQAGRVVSESEIVQQARLEAERLRQEVNEELCQQQSQADRYAEEVLCDLEAKISRTLTTIQNGRSQLSLN
ncbi:MAG TPA: hypothetical protein DD435_13630 [Cyanobacteria bacterium UBA8530]|nr:hypothetical protein [Cyanobacteria bacterium UBA8530]